MNLTEFLLARIAEDEAVAKQWPNVLREPPEGFAFWVDPSGHPIYQPRDRALAEVEAKRRIVELCKYSAQPPYSPYDDEPGWSVLCLLALPYADHPDWREEWRP